MRVVGYAASAVFLLFVLGLLLVFLLSLPDINRYRRLRKM